MADEGFKRKLTAILSADVEGYSRLMGEDEDATIRTLTAYRELMSTLIQKHRGRVVDSPGDNLLAEFLSVVDAVRCAVEIQEELRVRNAELPENRRMEFRIGVNLGDVVEEGERIYGDGVNITARVEGLAEAGGICISGTVYDSIKNKLSLSYESLGEHTVKNIKEPVRVYRMRIGPEAAGPVVIEKKVRLRRWQKAALTAAAILVVVAGAWTIWNFYFRPPPIEPASVEKMAYPLPDKPSIAVLPFDNLSGDPEQDYIADGISENIITALSYIPQMFVIARNSSFTYKGKPVKVQQVSEELGVRYILEGSVLKSGEKIRITAQLIDALTGGHMWSERYDQDFNDFFNLLDEITLAIAVALQVELTAGEQASTITTTNLDAWRYFNKGGGIFQEFSKEAMVKSREFFKKALEIDPEYAAALTAMAWTHFMDAQYGYSDSRGESLKRAFELAKQSVKLDNSQPMAHSLMQFVYLIQKQYDKAIEEGRKAIALGPSNSQAHHIHGVALYRSGIFKESVQMLEKALRLHPHAPLYYFMDLCTAYYWAGRYEESLAIAEQLLARSKKTGFRTGERWGYWGSARAKVRLNREREAREDAAKFLEIVPGFSLESERRTTFYNPEIIDQEHEDIRKAGIPEHPPLKLPHKPSIAVLPFVNMSGDPEQEYFCNGFADQIINSIARIPHIIVIARHSSFAYKGKSVNIQQIARDLGVRYILEGSLQRDNENVRINTQLIDAKTGGHLWAENYDRKLDDIFYVQDEICKNIMVALQVKLTEGEIARLVADTVSIKAYEKYLKAREHSARRTKEDVLVARRLAQEVIAIDPEYAAAYLQVGWTYLDEVWFGMTKTPSESIARAEEMVQKAISLHGITASVNQSLCAVNTLKKDFDKAIYYGEKAVEQSPNNAYAHGSLGMALRLNGQYDEAILRFKKALQLNPVKAISLQNNLAWAYLYSKQYEIAISIWNKTLERNPDYLFAYMGLTIAYWFNGSEDQARQAAKNVLRINPKFSVGYWEKRSHLKDKALAKQIHDAWRKAGLK